MSSPDPVSLKQQNASFPEIGLRHQLSADARLRSHPSIDLEVDLDVDRSTVGASFIADEIQQIEHRDRSRSTPPTERSTFQRSHTPSELIASPQRSPTPTNLRSTFQRSHTPSELIASPQRSPTPTNLRSTFQRSHTPTELIASPQRSHTPTNLRPMPQNSHTPTNLRSTSQRPHTSSSTPIFLHDKTNNCQNEPCFVNFNSDPPAPPLDLPANFIQPDTYDGTQNFEHYESHFQDCSELAGWNERTKVLVLAANLRGEARDFYMNLPDMEKRDYYFLTARLTDRFGYSTHQSLWLNKLEARRRNHGESIASLGDDIRQLAQRAYSDLDIRAQERLALNQLYKLISVDMKCRCIDHSCVTVQEAVSLIEKYECILESPHPASIRALDSGSTVETAHTSDLTEAMLRIETRLNKIERTHSSPSSANNSKICFCCNSAKHLLKECPHNRKRSRRLQPRTQE